MVSANSARWLLAALLLAGAACATSGSTASSSIPESYNKFWQSTAQINEFPCLLNLPLLSIGKVREMDKQAVARLELPPGFSGVRQRLETASEKMNATRKDAEHYELGIKTLLYKDGNHYQLEAGDCLDGFYFLNNFISCAILVPAAESQACNAMDDSVEALQAAAYASNDAREAAGSRLEALGRMGADYGSYSGPEKGAYFTAKEALQADFSSINDSMGVQMGYSEQKPRFAAAVISSGSVKRSFAAGTARFSRPDDYAAAMNLMAGRDENLVTGWAAVCWNIDSAISGMEAAWNESEGAAQDEYSDADSGVSALEGDGCSLITAELISNFSEAATGPIRGSFNAAPPDERVAGARELLREARAGIADARRLSNAEYEEDYLARAIEKNQQARTSIAAAKSAAEEAKAEVQEIIPAADGLYERKRGDVRNAIDSFSTETPGSARLKANAERDYSAAVQLAETGRGGNSGKHLVGLAAALKKLESAGLWLSDENSSLESRRDAARDELERLKGILERAKNDGIDVSSEEEWLAHAKQGLESATAEDLENLREKAQLAEREICAKAAAQFGHLDGQISTLGETISAIRSYRAILGSASELEASFREFDGLKRNYASGGKLVPEKALGHYLEISEKLDEISQKVESSKAKMIQEMMEKTASHEVNWEGEPTLDEEMQASVSVRFANELPFGTNSSLSASISGDFPSGISVISKDGAIFSVDSSGQKITAYFTSVSANSIYSISLKGRGEEPARSIGRQQGRVISLSERELAGTELLEFEALRDLDLLKIPMELPEGAGRLSAEMENGRVAGVVNSGGTAEITAERVRKGRGSVILSYRIASPYSIAQGPAIARNIDNLTARVSYNLTVTSRLDLESIPVSLFIQNATGEDGVSVRGLGSASLRNLEQQASEGGIAVSWAIPSLAKGESATYEVSYEISDPGEYAGWLYSQASTLIDSLDGTGLIPEARLEALRGRLSSARSLLDEEKYLRAISELQGLMGDARAAARDAQIQGDARAAYGDELAQFREEEAALEGLHSGLSSAGLAEEARRVRNALDDADEYENEACDSARELDYAAASEKISAAREALQVDLSGLLSSRVESFSRTISLLERRGRALSLLGKETSTGDFQNELSGIRSSISEADYSSAAGRFADLNRSISAKGSEINSGFSLLVPEFEGYARETSSLKTEFESNLDEFSKSSDNETLLRQARKDLEKLGVLDSLLSNFSRSAEKPKFLEANAEKLAGVGAEIERINSTSASLAQAAQAYSELASSSFSEASLKLEQAKKILPVSEQYASQLQNLTSLLSDAESALSAGKYADAAVLSEKVRAGAARLINAASQVEQKQEGAGFSFQPAYLLLPLLFFLGLGYIFLKKKPEKKHEPKQIKRLEF